MNALVRRIVVTIGALLIFRLGSHIPVTAIGTPAGPLPEGALVRVSIFSLGIVPYLTAAVIIRLLSVVWSRLSRLERSGEAGRRAVLRCTLILTFLLAALQGYGVALGLQGAPGLVDTSDEFFTLRATTSMVGGVFFLIWLCEQITRHGIGNGLALVLSLKVLISLPGELSTALEALRQGVISGDLVLFHVVLWVVAVTLMVAVEGARRNVRVDFAERKVAGRSLPARSTVMPVKLNSAGLIPVMVAPWFWSLPLDFAVLLFGARAPWLEAVRNQMAFGKPAHLVVTAILIFALTFIYTSYVVDPEHAADRLAKQDGTIPGVAAGEPTAGHLDRLVSLTTVVGATYLTAVSLFSELLVARGAALPYEISGGSLLIVVCTVLDIRKQVRDVSLTNARGGRQ